MANEKRFLNESYYNSALPMLNELREAGNFCDITLKVDGQIFPAHRIILISASDYFNNMLSGDFMESNQSIIELQELSANAFQIILKYMYTGKLFLNEMYSSQILKASDFLQLSWPKEKCCNYMENLLCRENCLSMWKLASQFFCKNLERESRKLVLKYLKEFRESEEFLEISSAEINELFKYNEISPENLYNAIIDWVKYDLYERKDCLVSLLKNLKAQQISASFFDSTIFNEQILREDLSTAAWIVDNFARSKLKVELNEINSAKTFDESIFICDEQQSDDCYVYDFDNSALNILTKIPNIRHFCPVYCKGNIYLTCGEHQHNYVKYMSVYNIEKNIWFTLPLELERKEHASCVLDDSIYIVGGRKYAPTFKTLMRYDVNTGQLTSEKFMTLARYNILVSVHGKCIYSSGGCQSLERYDTREGKWNILPNTKNEFYFESAAIIFDELYCNEKDTDLVKRYDLRTNAMETLTGPTGSFNKLISVKDKLYTVCPGGIGKYDRDENKWSTIFVEASPYPLAIYLG